jgi:16S rRNA (cytidine1402-2'-O)-methyltransferase
MTLYVISTPIGNKDDITLRALEVLKSVDYLFCDDTRVTNKLLELYDIKKSLYVYNDFSNDNERAKIIKLLQDGKNVGLVSDAGTPLISDPGYKLVKEWRKFGGNTVAVCGASAILTALVSSGMPTDKFLFYGFMESKKELEKLKFRDETVILYESPRRVLFMLQDILDVLGDIDVCIGRELTKTYEEVKSGTVSEVLQYYKENIDKVKGEFVILLKNKSIAVDFDVEKVKMIHDTLSPYMRTKDISDFIVKIGVAGNKKEVYEFLNS